MSNGGFPSAGAAAAAAKPAPLSIEFPRELAEPVRSPVAMRVMLDACALGLAAALALFLRFGLGFMAVQEPSPLTVNAHLLAGALWIAGVVGALALNRLYDEDTLFPGGGEISRLIRSVFEAIALISIFVFISQSFYVSRAWFGLTVVLTLALVTTERLAMRAFLRMERANGRRRRRVVLVSKDPGELGHLLGESAEFEVVRRIPEAELLAYLSDENEARNLDAPARTERTTLLLKAGDFDQHEIWQIALQAGRRGHPVFISAALRSVGRDRLTVRELGGQVIVKLAPPRFAGARAVQKRAFDVTGAGFFLMLSLPLFTVIAAAVAVTSGLPIFYGQDRVGMNGRAFRMWKFRTMRPDAEAETGPVWTATDDARRTPLGAILRRLSVDELPQLWNVIKGDMSLVGPRPERPAFVGEFSDNVEGYGYRDRMRPGITGWAQAHGLRGNTSLDSRVEFDNWYIEHWSIALDFRIVLRTVLEVVRSTSAY